MNEVVSQGVTTNTVSRWPIWLLVAACAATAVIVPLIGERPLGLEQIRNGLFDAHSQAGMIFWQMRVPRMLLGMLAGAALSAAGVAFQAMFRNPLASPFTLGVSSGAGCGAVLALGLSRVYSLLGHGLAVSAAAFLGALVCVFLVYGLAGVRRGFSSNTLLLAGVSIGFICSAIILLVQYLSDQAITNETVRWLMGSLSMASYGVLGYAAPAVALGVFLLAWHWREMDLLMMGDLVAAGRGVDVRRARKWIYFSASVMVAAVVAHTGPIAFVGLVVPHVVRLVVGPMHGRLLPAALLGGACFLPICDVLAANTMRWVSGGQSALVIPVGVLTSLIGGVFFLGMLLGRRVETVIS